jgi:hypothetical protein
MDLDVDAIWPEGQDHLTLDGVRIVPVVHGRVEFACEVRRQFFDFAPTAVAVELPETLQEPVLRAVRKLPFISIVHYVNTRGEPAYLPVEPTDAGIEAVRLALESGLEVRLADRDTDHVELVQEHLPDPYALTRIGAAAYCRRVLKHRPRPGPGAEDDLFSGRPAQVQAGPPARGALDILQRFLRGVRPDPEDELREQTLAWHLNDLRRAHQRVLFVCGLSHVLGVIEALPQALARPLGRVLRQRVLVSALHPDSLRECLAEPPYLTAAYERLRRGSAAGMLDRMRVTVELVQQARDAHKKNSDEEVGPGALKTLFRFARNYALAEGGLAPDFYQLLVASKGCVDDNFAYEVWDLATTYPYIESPPSMPYLKLSIEDLYRHARYIRFHRKIKQRRQSLVHLIKKRKREKRPGDWKKQWRGGSICSYPPEDLVIEGYGDFLKKKAVGILSEEHSRVEPFSTSLLDGVDMRETLRNWHHDQTLYVRENQKVQGKVGAVVVIFDEDRGLDERYPWKMTWQGEHEQESDMALYATEPGHKVVGPGISRCEYGGLVMTYPPGRMFYVWEDPYFDLAQSKAERLLLAGLSYAEERIVVYVAAKPPRSRMRSVASLLDKKLQFIPIGQLSPLTLKKIRVLHVLDGHAVRTYAGEFIW